MTKERLVLLLAAVMLMGGCATTDKLAEQAAKMMDRYCLEVPRESRPHVQESINSKSQIGAKGDIVCPDEL